MQVTCELGPSLSRFCSPEFLDLTGSAQITVVTDRNLIESADVIVGPFDRSDTTLAEVVELPMLSEPMVAVVGCQHPLSGQAEVSLGKASSYQWAAPRPTANTTHAAALAISPRCSDNTHYS